MAFHLPTIYPITDTRISGLSHLEQVKRLIQGGAELIQLREKYLTPREFHAAAVECVNYARERRVPIIINDRVDIAHAVKASGVHLGQNDMRPEKARAILGARSIIGLSTHSVAQAVDAFRFPVDYIGFGPVFSTSTKQDPDPATGLDGVRAVREAVRKKTVVVIGGITVENFVSAIDAGADSVAIVSALMAEPDKIASKMRAFSRLMSSRE